MKRSPYALISFIAGIMLIVPAIFILIIDGLKLPESNPVTIIGFIVAGVLSFPEIIIQVLPIAPNFPVVLPLIAIVCGIVSIHKHEEKHNKAMTGMVLAVIALIIHFGMSLLYTAA